MTQYNITNNQSHGSNETHKLDLIWTYIIKERFPKSVYIWIISTVEIPIMLLTLYALCFLIKSHRAASVFVNNLIVSDLMQIICMVIYSISGWATKASNAHGYFLISGLYFMACIAFERYILVSHPIWHKTHQTLKISCLISGIIWFVPLIFAKIEPYHLYFPPLHRFIAYILPYLMIILCFVGTWGGLSHSISLTSQKRRMILGPLFLVLLTYTFIILPTTVIGLYVSVTDQKFWWNLPFAKVSGVITCLFCLNPLADCLLYLFMRSDVADLMPSFCCCCRSDTHQILVRYTTRTTQSSS